MGNVGGVKSIGEWNILELFYNFKKRIIFSILYMQKFWNGKLANRKSFVNFLANYSVLESDLAINAAYLPIFYPLIGSFMLGCKVHVSLL